MAIKISGSTIIDDSRSLVNVGVSTISALSVSGNINANGNIIGDSSTIISGISSVTATSYFGDGENLTGVGFKQDTQGNLVAGAGAGAVIDSDTCFNIMIGCNSGRSNCAGDHNLFLGCNTGCLLTSGDHNLMIGKCAGRCITSGTYNIAFGIGAMSGGTATGTKNIAIGAFAGSDLNTGFQNIFMGFCAGKQIEDGDNNVAIGCCLLYTSDAADE